VFPFYFEEMGENGPENDGEIGNGPSHRDEYEALWRNPIVRTTNRGKGRMREERWVVFEPVQWLELPLADKRPDRHDTSGRGVRVRVFVMEVAPLAGRSEVGAGGSRVGGRG